MGVRVGGVVAIVVEGEPARAALVKRVVRIVGHNEPRLDVIVLLTWRWTARPHVLAAIPMVLCGVPYFEASGTELEAWGQRQPPYNARWKYPGPEVLVRGPIVITQEGAGRAV